MAKGVNVGLGISCSRFRTIRLPTKNRSLTRDTSRGYFTWYRYENDIWVVTNQRLLDSLKSHWFHHRMASADLVDVEDIAVVREGFLQTIFKFGDLKCQTAGEQPNFVLAGIPDPVSVLGTIDRARDAARHALRDGVYDR